MAPCIPKTTLEQWYLLNAVVEHGGFSQAAERIHRSQSAVSYGISRLQAQLGVDLFKLQGRRAVLTDAGKVLLDQARPLIADMLKLEARAVSLAKGWESEICLAVDSMYPKHLLFQALTAFRNSCPQTSVVINEVILSGADEALQSGEADLAIGNRVPQGFFSEPLYQVRFLAVAHPQHPLHQLGRPLSLRDLSHHIHVVIRDSGRTAPRSEGWQGARQRWTVSSLETSIAAISYGMGFAWLPEHAITEELEQDRLRVLPLVKGRVRTSTLYLVHADSETMGPGLRQLDSYLRSVSGQKPEKADQCMVP